MDILDDVAPVILGHKIESAGPAINGHRQEDEQHREQKATARHKARIRRQSRTLQKRAFLSSLVVCDLRGP